MISVKRRIHDYDDSSFIQRMTGLWADRFLNLQNELYAKKKVK